MIDVRRIPSICTLVLFALAFLLILPAPARAGTAVLLRDIADDPAATASSDLRQLTPFKNQVAFVTDVADRFDSVWVSDGTGPGTRTVFQGCSSDTCRTILRILGTAGGHLFFYAQSDEEDNWRLWSTDGTRAGTLPLTTGDPASPGVVWSGGQVALSDRFAYFLGCGDACGVWRSDGTPGGTVLWKPYDGPGHLGYLTLAGDRLYSVATEFGSDPRLWAFDTRTGDVAVVASWAGTFGAPTALTAAAGKLFFFAPDTDETSVELWVSDGTAGGTRALTQFEAFNPFQSTEWMKEIGGRVYFVANDVVHGFELWRSDGTPRGTVRVSDFEYSGALSGLSPDGLVQAGGKIVFTAHDGLTDTRLWITDGRPESTAPFRSLCPQGGCDVRAPSFLVQIGGKAFFSGENGLWSTDGTRAGTRRFSGPLCTDGCSFEGVFQALQGKIVFAAKDAAHGIELWTSDGTAAGTRRLTDVPGTSARPLGPVVAAGRWIFFRGRDSHGDEPWVTDGRETRLLADLSSDVPGSVQREPTPVGDRLFFTACDGGERSLWVSGGTPETTVPVPGTAGSCWSDFFGITDLTAASGRLFFLQRDAAQIRQLWSTDGGAPVQVSHLASADDSIDAFAAIEFQGRLLVPIRTDGQLALWQSNAAGDGLVKKVDLPDLSAVEMWAAGGEVYFRGSGPIADVGLWRTDGTQGGTRQLAADVSPDSNFVRLASSVLFIAESRDDFGYFEAGLWKTDGTAAGTFRVLPVGGFFEPRQELILFQEQLYFFAPSEPWTLWRSDGTAAGTVVVRQFADLQSPDDSPRFGLTVSAGKLFFTAVDSVHGRELWTSDGTADGTRMVLDLNPGKAAGAPDLDSTLAAAGGKLYFTGDDGVHGTELWESDGTASGTRLVQDLAPEAASSRPGDLTAAGDHLFFAADDLLSGREPWALLLSGPAGCQPSSTRLCLSQGRYQVEASWLTGQQSGHGTAVSLSTDTGYFWFFNQANVELVVKVLDGQGVNGHVWVFYGALSNVEYSLTVTDTQTGLTRRYFNPQGTLASVGDTHGFGPLGASSANPTPPVARAAASPLPLISERTDKAATVPCQATAQRLCLNNGRFAVEVSWKDFDNHTGTGTAVPLTTDTGTFWFFNAANVELVVKVLDGRPVNGKFWLFYGALSNVEYTLTVTDTQTGTVRTYMNPKGRFASVADTGAF